MTSEHQYVSRKDEGDKVIVFEKGNLVFVFNFHWEKSFPNYRVGCIKPGKYKVITMTLSILKYFCFWFLPTLCVCVCSRSGQSSAFILAFVC